MYIINIRLDLQACTVDRQNPNVRISAHAKHWTFWPPDFRQIKRKQNVRKQNNLVQIWLFRVIKNIFIYKTVPTMFRFQTLSINQTIIDRPKSKRVRFSALYCTTHIHLDLPCDTMGALNNYPHRNDNNFWISMLKVFIALLYSSKVSLFSF